MTNFQNVWKKPYLILKLLFRLHHKINILYNSYPTIGFKRNLQSGQSATKDYRISYFEQTFAEWAFKDKVRCSVVSGYKVTDVSLKYKM